MYSVWCDSSEVGSKLHEGEGTVRNVATDGYGSTFKIGEHESMRVISITDGDGGPMESISVRKESGSGYSEHREEEVVTMPTRAFLVAQHDIPAHVEMTFNYGRHYHRTWLDAESGEVADAPSLPMDS